MIATILLTTIVWKLHLIPLSKSIFIREQTKLLTGKTFWSSEVFGFEEVGFRGEGYTIEIFQYDQTMQEYFYKPDSQFFNKYPLELEYRSQWSRHTWKETPVTEAELEYLHHATPTYTDWTAETVKQISFVRALSLKKGSYYAYNNRGEGNVDFFLIAPHERLVVLINHNQ